MPSLASDKEQPVASASSISIEVFKGFEPLRDWRAEWDNFTLAAGGSIYMSFDWCRVWWEFYGNGRDLRILTFHRGDQIVAIVPMYIDVVGFFPIKLRVARLVGASIPPKAFDPPVLADVAEEVLEKIVAHFIEDEQCDVISFGPTCQTWKGAESAQRFRSRRASSAWVECEPHAVFCLPSTFPEYLGSLDKNRRKTYEYSMRALRKQFAVTQDVVMSPDKLESEFDQFAEMHAAQWNEEGRPGHFKAWPNALDYNRAQVKAQGQHGRVRFARIVANDNVISSQYTFRFGDRCYWELPARVTGQEWRKFSLGSTGLVCMIDEGMSGGIREIEAGIGHYDYKIQLGAKELPVRSLRIVDRRVSSRLKLQVWKLIGFLIQLFYHKIWYTRVQPRLPLQFRAAKWALSIRINFLYY